MSDPKMIDLDFEGDRAELSIDLDLDGEKSAEFEVNMTEGFQEVIDLIKNKQKSQIPMPKFQWGLEGTTIWCSLDLDQDTVPCIKAKVNVGELISESIGRVFKR